MFQSSGKYQPLAHQLERVAPAIIDMGCFSRVETNGGAFEQVQLLAGENPNQAVRTFTKPFREAGIKTHMLDRALNALRMYPCPSDVRRLMYRVKHAQGVDITRIFDGLNDPRNVIPSIRYAKEAGMTPQATLCITHSPVHTVDYYADLADTLIEAGAEEICLKDMAGIGRPTVIGQIVRRIKEAHPDIVIEYHGHIGPGFSVASMLEAARAGVDILDTAVEPLSWGKIHPDVITIREMLRADGFEVPEINMKAYMQVRTLTQEFVDDFLGYYINEQNLQCSSLLIGCGLPGGMMGSMMSDLQGIHEAINMFHRQKGEPEISIDDLMVKLFDEVAHIWPKLGYPPLVTPYSQYTKNIALMNVFNMERGGDRWQAIDEKAWGMILGKNGRVPGPVAEELRTLAEEKGLAFTDADPQTNYPDDLDRFRRMMDEEGWDYGEDDEELFELAMHEPQYRDYRSGVAKERFLEDLEQKRAERAALRGTTPEEVRALKRAAWTPVTAPTSGQILWEIDLEEGSAAPQIGTAYRRGSCLCEICPSGGYREPVTALVGGRIREVVADQGAMVRKGDVICYMDDDEATLPAEEKPTDTALHRPEEQPYSHHEVLNPSTRMGR